MRPCICDSSWRYQYAPTVAWDRLQQDHYLLEQCHFSRTIDINFNVTKMMDGCMENQRQQRLVRIVPTHRFQQHMRWLLGAIVYVPP